MPLPDMPPPDLLQPDASLCGNAKLDPTEVCDGALLGGKTCKTQGFTGGSLACKACKLDTLLCYEVRDPKHLYMGTNGTTWALNHPRVASDGSSFFAVWTGFKVGGGTASWVEGAMVDAQGKVSVKQKHLVNTAPAKYDADVAFNGKDYLVVWSQPGEVRGSQVSTAGSVADPVGKQLVKKPAGRHAPRLAFDGTNNLLVHWFDSGGSSKNRQIWAQRVSTAPAAVGAALKVSAGTHYLQSYGITPPAVAFDGLNYLVVWSDLNNIHAARVSPAGVRLNSANLVISNASGTQRNPAAAGSAAGSMVTFEDTQSGGREINGVRVNKTGTVSKPGWVSVSSKLKCNPAVAFDGKHYLVVWAEGCLGTIRGIRMDPTTGKAVDPSAIPLSMASSPSESAPALAYAGGQYMVIWIASATNKPYLIEGTRLRFGKAP